MTCTLEQLIADRGDARADYIAAGRPAWMLDDLREYDEDIAAAKKRIVKQPPRTVTVEIVGG